MASGKKRRKQVKLSKKAQSPAAGPFRHRDGDRRQREAMAKAVQLAKVEKAALSQIGAVELPEDPDEDT